MFCNRCGNPFPDGSRYCARCGAAVLESVAPRPDGGSQHRVHTLGILWMIMGGLCLLPSFFFTGFHLAGFHPIWSPPFGPIAFLFGIPSVLLGLGAIFLGWGLLRGEPWARTAAIVAGILFIFHPPFGTVLGIFTLWTFLSQPDHSTTLPRP